MQLRRWRGVIVAIAAVALLNAAVLATVLISGLRTGGPADLRFSQGDDVTTLDPAKMTALIDGRIATALFEGLTVTEPATLQPRAGVAESWTISPDGLVYTFKLRREARWSDGASVTAEDFRYSWLRVLDVRTAAQYNYMLFPIKGAEAYNKATAAREKLREERRAEQGGDLPPGDDPALKALAEVGIEVLSPHEMRITLAKPTSYFLSLLAFSTYLPVRKSCLETVRDGRTVEDDGWVFPGRIVGNGAYVLKDWVYKARMRLEKNEHYWNRDNVRLAVIDILPIEAQNTAFINYERGQIDLLTAVPNAAVEKLLVMARQGQRPDFHLSPTLGTYFYRFNCTRPPLNDPRVRRALALAIDKEEIITKVGRAGQPLADRFVPPGIPGYSGPAGLRRDPELARRLLAEAGFPGGKGFPRLVLLYNTDEGHKNAAELACEAWKRELGIDLQLTNVEFKVYLEKARTLDYDLCRAGWYGDYVDPNTFLDMFITGGENNETGWSNPAYDALIKKAAETVDPAARMAVFKEAETILVEQELPILPIYNYVSAVMCRPAVRGFTPNLRNEIRFQDLWLEPALGPAAAPPKGAAAATSAGPGTSSAAGPGGRP